MDAASPTEFLNLIRRQKRGKFKVYIGMIAGVGKTFRMLQEAHALLQSGVDVRIAYVETHGRKDTHALLEGLPLIPRRKLFYKGKELEEMDVQTVINLQPEIVIVDELAHSNIEGSKNQKRWQDVQDLLEAGIHVISAVNIQHIESLQDEVKAITGIEVSERIPDSIITHADEVVNIDLTAEELISRLKEGKIYEASKVARALAHFFKQEHILQLRELALKEVAAAVERKVATEVPQRAAMRQERFMACISSNEKIARNVIRKTARLANYYNSKWFVLYVQTARERADKIPLDKQRHLIHNFKLAAEMGAEVMKVSGERIAEVILAQAAEHHITTICLGKPHVSLWRVILATGLFHLLLKKMAAEDIDIIILS